ncbi:MAG: RNA 2',3'-cyclic phosphodiesterase [Gammaproteobacteria bacterium]|nr:RNA 2',3'-cyclic phosphodiesterase [Gammaproteobacteria bacterium]MDH5591702.1 RNA 2',3'-cyclic phosphodiesterase [Gammaproteobacteria bacterium]
MKKLFLALWPEDKIRKKIATLNQSITSDQLQKYKPENLHVTLAFLGNVSNEVEQIVRQGTNEIIAEPVSIVFDQLTLWPKGGILCLTSARQPQSLLDLVNAINNILHEAGVRIDSRPYVAHVTLGRRTQLKPTIPVEPILWNSTSFVLVESVSVDDGVEYQVLQRWPLIKTVK